MRGPLARRHGDHRHADVEAADALDHRDIRDDHDDGFDPLAEQRLDRRAHRSCEASTVVTVTTP